ncbi:unnamed protein product [Adineta ricciae]|uniref:Uncharacterized protein n=1 Tax=Adineta ricciae TaxID=249248 RepID=A0A816D9I2_ADIRI|nr:unnamed protein product [Adineta ricciae]CAF1633013.1 unnamed protein product [Adineta ricciae]
MNLIQVRRCGNVHCLSHQQQQSIDNTMIFTRPVYHVDATILCHLIQQVETKRLSKSFGQLLYLTSISRTEVDRQVCPINSCNHQQRSVFLLANIPDLISVAIDWNTSHLTTSDVEDLVSTIDSFVYLRELFYDVTINEARIKQLNLIGLICFYGGNVEVFFSYDPTTSKWLFCFDGNIVVSADWNAVQRKCIDFHLQPFLLIYANPDRDPVDISQLLKRTVIQTKNNHFIPDERRLEQTMVLNNKKTAQITTKPDYCQQQANSAENLQKISSFATLNSSMLFMPKPTVTTSYINQETVVKVMQQQLLKKETLSDTTSLSSSTASSPIVHVRHRMGPSMQSREDASSSGDSSRDSGLSSGINDESSEGSPRDSLSEHEPTVIDGLIKQTEQMMNDDHHLDISFATIEHFFEESVRHETATNYSSAVESCQQALILVEQILNLNHHHQHGISIYARTKKNSLLLRIRSLQKRQIDEQEHLSRSSSSSLSTFKPVDRTAKKNENIYDNNVSKSTSILSSTTKTTRPKKNVKFSDNVALIVPTSDDTDEPPSEHLIHSFLRKIQQQQQQQHQSQITATTASDSDSDTPSSSNDIPIGLSECSLCHKRCSKNNQIGTYCSNCHYYMQRFQPTTS